ncbi:tripartite tricarboxylate transporter TctB family protein [Azoarcus sp. L1K30]|uniref:tripartite tricarboxylate transporter TctB family protein n=1 Tax=Azoarcus sp. L1K30 TaxID=2820277 RepID=UPI001B815D29|nr:tripartite tricarboxylate transporter TctB family protein [Azoarcus sp. L1K30]MBR0567565.1 tripartite tricarboxylate transporter TctB family protein [Azoarcus sp. L1K30]
MDTLAELLKVQIDFEQSHLLFPSIVEWVLGGLMLAIIVVHGPELLAQWRNGALRSCLAKWQVDKKRLFGCLALTLAYFIAMEPVGTLYPNSGIGFLLTSIVYGFALSRLFVHDINRRKWMLIALSSVLTPLFVWVVFAHLFRITLP